LTTGNAIDREKQLKGWRRSKKMALIGRKSEMSDCEKRGEDGVCWGADRGDENFFRWDWAGACRKRSCLIEMGMASPNFCVQ
jgi:hypothetical protein